ncbi:MAG TPA: nitrate/nitrite transporter [Motilibacteraceae bacterium]|nr:nitrate/nitrite transporter [Motilibacteraceae bacterium]
MTTTAAPTAAATRPRTRRGRWIEHWEPEDPRFWEETGRGVARRNLAVSVLTEHVGFSVWTLWSVLVLFLGKDYGFAPEQKFLLTTVPALVGSVLRLPYTLAVARFGGRTWTVASALLLLVPSVAAAVVLEPGVGFGTLLVVAALAGVGGGNFASSMANINAFYPQRLKGRALGINAGGGNVGVATVQLAGLAVLAVLGVHHPRALLGIYLPLVVVGAVLAALLMDNLATARNDTEAMRLVLREPHAWVLSLLYVGTFGSFIGFGFAFGQVLQVQFGDRFATPVDAAYLTFLGPLIGSLIRPVGGWFADRWGGARTTVATFMAMAAAGLLVLLASREESLALFVTAFVVLFALSGIGNGSTYAMIPAVFAARAGAAVAGGSDESSEKTMAQRLSGALIGIAGAVGAFGGVLVNLAFRQSFLTTHRGDAAYAAFVVAYLVGAAMTWTVYVRRSPRRLAGV